MGVGSTERCDSVAPEDSRVVAAVAARGGGGEEEGPETVSTALLAAGSRLGVGLDKAPRLRLGRRFFAFTGGEDVESLDGIGERVAG